MLYIILSISNVKTVQIDQSYKCETITIIY